MYCCFVMDPRSYTARMTAPFNRLSFVLSAFMSSMTSLSALTASVIKSSELSNVRREWCRTAGARMQTELPNRHPLHAACWTTSSFFAQIDSEPEYTEKQNRPKEIVHAGIYHREPRTRPASIGYRIRRTGKSSDENSGKQN